MEMELSVVVIVKSRLAFGVKRRTGFVLWKPGWNYFGDRS